MNKNIFKYACQTSCLVFNKIKISHSKNKKVQHLMLGGRSQKKDIFFYDCRLIQYNYIIDVKKMRNSAMSNGFVE